MSRLVCGLSVGLLLAAGAAHADDVHAASPVGAPTKAQRRARHGPSALDVAVTVSDTVHAGVTFLALLSDLSARERVVEVVTVEAPPPSAPPPSGVPTEPGPPPGDAPVAPPPAPAPRVEEPLGSNPGVTLRLDGLALDGGGGAQLGLGLEGYRWGFLLDATGLERTGGHVGALGGDKSSLLSLHLTWAAVAHERLRLRAEGGLALAQTPSASFLGWGVGTSLEACVLGPLDLELRATYAFAPFTQLDARAGVALRLGVLSLRGGVRALYFHDQGRVADAPHADALLGPYVGLGFGF